MRAYRWCEDIALLILNVGTRRRLLVSFTPWSLYSRGKLLVGTVGLDVTENILPLPGIEPRIFQPQRDHYTDYVMPAPVISTEWTALLFMGLTGMWRSGFSTTSRLSWWVVRVHGRNVECGNKYTEVKIHLDVKSNAYVIKFFDWRWGWRSVGGVAIREGIRQPRNRGSIPVSDFILFFSGVTIPALGVHPASHLVGTGSTFHRHKLAGARNSLHLVLWLRRRGAITWLTHTHSWHAQGQL